MLINWQVRANTAQSLTNIISAAVSPSLSSLKRYDSENKFLTEIHFSINPNKNTISLLKKTTYMDFSLLVRSQSIMRITLFSDTCLKRQ